MTTTPICRVPEAGCSPSFPLINVGWALAYVDQRSWLSPGPRRDRSLRPTARRVATPRRCQWPSTPPSWGLFFGETEFCIGFRYFKHVMTQHGNKGFILHLQWEGNVLWHYVNTTSFDRADSSRNLEDVCKFEWVLLIFSQHNYRASDEVPIWCQAGGKSSTYFIARSSVVSKFVNLLSKFGI